jgi:sugar phosphate isomerase/epimerase
MKLAFSTLACPKWSWAEAIEAARSYGYDGIEWRLVDGEVVTSAFSPQTCEQIRNAMAKAGLLTCALDSGVSLALPAGPDRDRQIAEARGLLKVARLLGTDMVRMFPGKYPASVTDDEAVSWVVEGSKLLIPEAKASGVKIALEIHDSFDWKRRELRGTSSSQFTAKAAAQLNAPEVGILWDLGNPYLEGESADQTWENVKDQLIYVHSKDMRPTTGGAWEYVPMGEGVIPIPQIVGWLKQIGFDGWFSFEWEKKWHPELAEPEIVLPHYVEYMRARLRDG